MTAIALEMRRTLADILCPLSRYARATATNPYTWNRTQRDRYSWDASKHPRGQPDNSGQFSEKPETKTPKRPKPGQIPSGHSIVAGGLYFDRSQFSLKLVDITKLKVTEEIDSPAKVQSIEDALSEGKRLPPIVVGRTGRVLDGHHRLEAARRAGMTHIWAMKQKTHKQIANESENP